MTLFHENAWTIIKEFLFNKEERKKVTLLPENAWKIIKDFLFKKEQNKR